ncbi:Pyridoxal kinase PdxY [Sporomusa rhizae]|uniref:pyridoxamine kinase n=1 Tax=Sporomusa rhizae TaxID=357999 RepID=UPI00352AFC14
MRPVVPRVAAVHDISCVGRCSLTVIMPILSCMGIQVCPLPTAVLSTHLGGFSDVAFHDFTDQMSDFFQHWKREGISFDCIYSGFLASGEQIDTVTEFIDEFSANKPLVLVDPVMGDEGRLYSVYTPKMQEHMKRLICKADIITPNFTEACFLLGECYQERILEPNLLKDWLVRLAGFGPSQVVMTGIPIGNRQIMNIGYEQNSGAFWEVVSEHIPARYPGTGDIFASILAGALLWRQSLPEAMKLAADFVAAAIKATYKADTPTREGVLLETVLPQLGLVWAKANSEKEGGSKFD